MEDLSKKLLKINKDFENGKYNPLIKDITFISYKNFTPKSFISFDFPLTILVGKNGTNKSSAIIALYGCVQGKVISDFWFATPIDTIDQHNRPRFYYSYAPPDTDATAQVLQQWMTKQGQPDYWETARPKTTDGMLPIDSSISSSYKVKTRWKKIEKNILYINFKSNISAFDKFFYHSENPSKSENLDTKQNYIRKYSNNLSVAIKDKLKSDLKYNKEKIINQTNEELDPRYVKLVSEILGKKYSKILYIEHRYFHVDGGTAILYTDNLKYSEAFAGSGEFSLVSLIYKISKAAKKSLILLDEPEVSLHPGAQRKLLKFILDMIIEHKHQVVISTHSSHFVKSLPPNAIKLFKENGETKKIDIINNVEPEFAFTEIGSDVNKTTIYTEDRLTQALINIIIDNDNNLKSRFTTQFLGGADTIRKHYTYTFSRADNRTLIIFDGDKKTLKYIENNNSFKPTAAIPSAELKETIINYYGTVAMPIAESTTVEAELTTLTTVYDFIQKNVKYFHFHTPEEFLTSSESFKKMISINKVDIEKEDHKNSFKKLTASIFAKPDPDSDDIFTAQRLIISDIFKNESHLLEPIKKLLS